MTGLVALVSGALLLAQACCTFAVPPSQRQTTAVEGAATAHILAAERGESRKNEYMLAMRSTRKTVRLTGCNTSFNGQPISPQYCTADFIKFSTPEFTCDEQLVVTVDQKVHAKVVGAELALYKLPETYDAESTLNYKVSIYCQDVQAQPLVVHHIPASSSGWQVLHLELPHKTHWPNARIKLTLSISATGPHGDTPLPCSAVSTLFILNPKKIAIESGITTENLPSNPAPYFPMFVTFLETSRKCGNPPCAVALKRPKRRALVLNNYIRTFYYRFIAIKRSNCSDTLLGNKVSYNLCRSNKIIFAPIEENSTFTSNNSFKLCSNVSPPGTSEEILGRDLIIYKRPLSLQNVMLEVFLIEEVNQQWEELVANSTVQTNASGWQVFHIDTYSNVTGAGRICIDVYVRAHYEENVAFLNKTELMDMFVLDSYTPEEYDKTPLMTTFVYKHRNFQPLFRKKRLLQDVTSFLVEDKNKAECLFQDHIVNLSEYLQMRVVYPEVANLGQCIGDSYTQQVGGTENEDKDSVAAVERLHTSHCVPTKLEDLNVVVSEGDYISVITLPKAITTECGWGVHDTY